MNVLLIFVLLFLLTLNVEVESSNMETSSAVSTASEPLKTSSSTPDGRNNTSDSVHTTSSRETTGSTVNTTKSGNYSDSSCPQTSKDADAGNPFSFLKLDLKTVLTFLMGVICSTLIFSTVLCFVAICNRCKATDAETDKEGIILEAVKQEHDQSVMKSDEGLEEQDPLQVQTPAEVSTNTSAVYRGTEEERKILEKEQTLTEVDYASINYSLLQKNDDGDLKPKKVESDYAEIQLKKVNEEEAVQTMQDEMKNSGEAQDGAKQDGVDHDLEGGMESQKQEELEEVQV